MNLFDLKGRVALVTGGNGGIGLGMARGLAQAGAAIAIAGRNAAKSRGGGGGAGQARRQDGGRSTVDVADEASVPQDGRGHGRKQLGRLDILVNNAGINIRKPPHETLARPSGSRSIDTNLTSAFTCSHAAYPLMKKAGGGKIINIGSMMSIFGAALRAGLRRLQGRHRAAHQGAGHRPGPRTTSRSTPCCRAGSIPTSPSTRARARSSGLNTMVLMRTPAGRWGDARRPVRHRRVPGQQGLRLRHRHGHSGRRRLFGAGLAALSAPDLQA